MKTYSPKPKENSKQAVANNIATVKTPAISTGMVDKRPEAVRQMKLQKVIDNSQGNKNVPVLQARISQHTAMPVIQKKENKTGMPDGLKAGIENLSGYSMDDVKVHYHSGKPAQLQAHAYAQGTDIHIAPGQEKHLPHEAWHVVQQKQGRVRPTIQLKANLDINDDANLENEADVMGKQAVVHNTTSVINLKEVKVNNATNPLQAKWYVLEDLLDLKGVYLYQNDETGLVYDPETFMLYHVSDRKGGKQLDYKSVQLLMEEVARDIRETDMERLTSSKDGRVAWTPKEAVDYYVEHAPSHKPDDSMSLEFGKGDWTLEGHKTMEMVLASQGRSYEDYLAPESKKKGLGKKITAFNSTLKQIAEQPVYKKPFTVTINVGDLKGLGDITAGAKLAKELKEFYDQFNEWKKVTVELYLDKVENLSENSKNKDEITKIERMVRDLIGGAKVHLVNFDEKMKKHKRSATISYPAHNINGDVKVQQYGYNQLESEHGFGSGPGYGALGVLALDSEKQEQGIALAKDPGQSKNMRIVEGLSRLYKVRETHFAYFSIYAKPVKEFTKNVCENVLEENTAFVYARSAESMDAVADSIRDLKGVGQILKIVVDKGKFDIDEHNMRKKDVNGLPIVLLINFADGVQNVEMLALYYKSEGAVGATGDQSFMEAYAMRRRKNKDRGKMVAEPDIWYDVQEQQEGLYKELLELKSGEYKEGSQKGLKPIDIDENINDALDQKLLLYPMIMLINGIINKKAK
ncbi:MAG: DUF4157 domain-containing protein [Chitinophagaceae bacterium]